MRNELFEKWGIEIKSSAKKIDDVLKAGTPEAYKTLDIRKGKLKYEWDDLLRFVNDDEKRKILSLTISDSVGNFRDVLKQISADKKATASKLNDQKLAEAAEMSNGTTGKQFGVIYGTPIQLFKSTPTLNINEADIDFFSNFRYTDDGQLLYRDISGKLHFLFMTIKGLDFKNEIGASGEDSLWDQLISDLGVKYEQYCKLANVAWAKCMPDDNLEEIFTGMKFDDSEETYVIPSFMANLIQPQPIYRKTDDGEKFDKFRVVAIDKKLLFSSAMDLLALNWKSWTKGMIKRIYGWKQFSNTDTWATNCLPIPEDWQHAEMPESWKSFFEGNGGKASPRMLDRVYFFIGSCLDATNYNQQCLIICDDGGTGKGELTRMLKDILPRGFTGDIQNSALAEPRFAVFSHGLYKHHLLFLTEYNGADASKSDLFKNLTGGDEISCEIKGGENFKFNAAGLKMIITSNRVCYTKEDSVRRRIIPVTFRKNFAIGENFGEMDKAQLRKDGKDFLRFCYRRYMTSPFRTKDGGYIVMNKAQAEAYKESGKKIDMKVSPKYFLLKAFSADDELCSDTTRWFRCGDYTEETHLNDGYEDIYDSLFEEDPSKFLTVKDVKTRIATLCFNDRLDLKCELDFIPNYDPNDDLSLAWQSMKTKKNADFIAFMEKTKPHSWGVVKKVNGKPERVVTGIRVKTDKSAIDKVIE